MTAEGAPGVDDEARAEIGARLVAENAERWSKESSWSACEFLPALGVRCGPECSCEVAPE